MMPIRTFQLPQEEGSSILNTGHQAETTTLSR